MTLADLASEIDLPKPTLLRLLNVLESEAFVFRAGNPASYALGHSLLDISDSYRRSANVANLAAPYLKELASDTGLTSNLGVLEGQWALHISVQEPDRPLRFRSTEGSLDYAYCTSIGKMLMAQLPDDRIDGHLPDEPFERFTESTMTAKTEVYEDLDLIRSRGFSIDDQERDLGVTCLAVEVPLGLDIPVAISLAGPSGELSPDVRERFVSRLTEFAEKLASDSRFVASFRVERIHQGNGASA